jgi:hypothetical protein
MSVYPLTIRRCQHIKVNGTQCGSPALRDQNHCYFHTQWRSTSDLHRSCIQPSTFTLPTLEDANSIQVGLAEVMRLVVIKFIDFRTAALLLNALRTAASNVRFTSLEPKEPTHVVIDPASVENRPIGASAWSTVEGQEYDSPEPAPAPTRSYWNDETPEELAEVRERYSEANYQEGIARRKRLKL